MNMESNIIEVNIDDIIPNRFQPRLSFDEQGLKELSSSIKEHGIIQPLVLRKVGDKYEIIAGERRYKASTMAGLTKVPAIISNIDDNKSAEVALVENIQRRNLTAIEEARSYKSLLDKGYLTQEQLAKKMGLSQSAIANKLRLLNLDEEVQDALLEEKISERHARALLSLSNKEDQKEWLHKIMKERLTVRQLDLELKKLKEAEEESSVIPLVDLTPNIDSIINNAQDLHPQEAPKDLSNLLEPDSNFTPLEPSTPNTLESPVAEPTPTPESKGRFFNFLEEESANMSMDEPATQTVFQTSIPEETKEEPDFEVLDLPSLAAASMQKLDIPSSIPAEISSEPVAPKIEEVMPTPENSNLIDPVSMIDTLNSNYEEELAIAQGRDLKTAIEKTRNTIKSIEDLGFMVDKEEIDFDDYYQFVIKIEK